MENRSKRARVPGAEAGSDAQILGKWLGALDDFRNWLVCAV
jgi:hypothetical protein